MSRSSLRRAVRAEGDAIVDLMIQDEVALAAQRAQLALDDMEGLRRKLLQVRWDAIHTLTDYGWPRSWIAKELGLSYERVRQILSSNRPRGVFPPVD